MGTFKKTEFRGVDGSRRAWHPPTGLAESRGRVIRPHITFDPQVLPTGSLGELRLASLTALEGVQISEVVGCSPLLLLLLALTSLLGDSSNRRSSLVGG